MASNNSNKDDNKNDFDTAFKDALLLKRQKDRERKRAQRLALTEEKKETIREQDREKKSIIMIEKKKAREDANTMSKKQMYDLRLAAPQENTLSTTKKKIMLNRISKYF